MIKLFKKEKFFEIGLLNIGHFSFYLGVFLLSSALPFALVCFLISIILVIYKKGKEFFFMYDLLPLYLATFLMIFGNFYSIFFAY